MNLEIMKMMLDENAIQFFRGIRNRFNEKWQFTGKGSTNRNRQLVPGPMSMENPNDFATDCPLNSDKEQEIEIRENKVLKVTIKEFGGYFNS